MKKLIYLLPTITVILAVLKLILCNSNDSFCISWVILFLPVTLYALYFLYGLLTSVRKITQAVPNKEDIDITFK